MEPRELVGKRLDWNKIENFRELCENTMVIISKCLPGRGIIYYHKLQVMRWNEIKCEYVRSLSDFLLI